MNFILQLPLEFDKNIKQAITILAKYSYLSDGTKLSATDASGNGLYYVGSLVYEKQGGVLSVESAGFGGGRFLVSQTSGGTMYSPHYYVTDHLGSTRVITNVSGQVQEACDYYPFGLRWQAGTLTTNRYRYNGKEEQGFLNVPYIDYGARMRDPKFGIGWNGGDRLAEKYYATGQQVFCLNNPISGIDIDGRLVVFINGFHSGDGGTTGYWAGFDEAFLSHFNDKNRAKYLDGSMGGLSAFNFRSNGIVAGFHLDAPTLSHTYRIGGGYNQGKSDAAAIIASLARDAAGNIVEKLRIVAHSMGAAYAKGYIEAIIEYAQEYPELCQGLSIDEYDFAAYQQNLLSAIPGIPTFQYDNNGDKVVNGGIFAALGGSKHARQSGVKIHNSDTNPDGGHGIEAFKKAVFELEAGDYVYINGVFIPITK